MSSPSTPQHTDRCAEKILQSVWGGISFSFDVCQDKAVIQTQSSSTALTSISNPRYLIYYYVVFHVTLHHVCWNTSNDAFNARRSPRFAISKRWSGLSGLASDRHHCRISPLKSITSVLLQLLSSKKYWCWNWRGVSHPGAVEQVRNIKKQYEVRLLSYLCCREEHFIKVN